MLRRYPLFSGTEDRVAPVSYYDADTIDDLPVTYAVTGDSAYVRDTNFYYFRINDQWVQVGSSGGGGPPAAHAPTHQVNGTDPLHWPYYDVRDFGAVGDGVTDDTEAIQDAVDAAAGVQAVFFPGGTYKVTSAITLPIGSKIIGAGRSTTVISIGSNVIRAFQATPTADDAMYEFSNISIDGDSTVGQHGIFIANAFSRAQAFLNHVYLNSLDLAVQATGASVFFNDVRTRDTNTYVTKIVESFGAVFTTCEFNCPSTASPPAVAIDTNNLQADNLLVRDGSVVASFGSRVNNSIIQGDLWVREDSVVSGSEIWWSLYLGDNCEVSGCKAGTVLRYTGRNGDEWQISGCLIWSGIQLLGDNCVVSGCYLWGASPTVDVQGNNNLVTGCLFEPGSIPFTISGGATGTAFTGNINCPEVVPFINPAAIASDQNNYDIGVGKNFRLTTNGSNRTITGFAGGVDGREITIVNVSANDITISNQSASSDPANRVITGTGADAVLQPDDIASLLYDGTTQRWRVVL